MNKEGYLWGGLAALALAVGVILLANDDFQDADSFLSFGNIVGVILVVLAVFIVFFRGPTKPIKWPPDPDPNDDEKPQTPGTS